MKGVGMDTFVSDKLVEFSLKECYRHYRVLEIYFLVSVIWSDTLQNFVCPNKLLSVRNNF